MVCEEKGEKGYAEAGRGWQHSGPLGPLQREQLPVLGLSCPHVTSRITPLGAAEASQPLCLKGLEGSSQQREARAGLGTKRGHSPVLR